MLDSVSCPRSHSRWVSLTWLISGRLTQPLSLSIRLTLLAFFLVLLALAAWMLWQPPQRRWLQRQLRHWRWNRRRTQSVVVLTLICLLLTSPSGLALVTKALTSQIPPDSGAKADAIVVLGRGSRFMYDRIDATAALWQANRASRIFVSGRGDSKPIVRQLLAKGIPDTAIEGENCSLTTEENARFTANLLLPQSVKQIILVTDYPHMLRSRLTFQSYGFEVISHPNALPLGMGYRERLGVAVREYGGLLSYVIRGRFGERESTDRRQGESWNPISSSTQ
ncbi:MAG: YdcF family protein [Stenomitos rutilans HA7619-LM2]|jgi:uncharacterized SAM-binding protein YcdF (DUF218 family)|nr:YdcF family protein [Stenomitos rutilans HA7619-LM2]